MRILRAMTEKPWLTPGLDSAAADGEARARRSDAGTGLGVFLGVVTVLFTIITSAYVMRMGVHGPGHGGGDWTPLREPPLLWVNTGALILSSLAWQVAVIAADRGGSGRLRAGLLAGGLLGIVFLVGQIVVWRQLQASGYFLAAHGAICAPARDPLALPTDHFLSGSPAVAFFYLITALHGLHIAGGLVAWGRTASRVLGGAEIAAVRRPVVLTARYWHFLLFIWLLMFGLLLLT